jgi:enoyl-CoA hydratase
MSGRELVVVRDGPLLRLTINRPEKRNALSRALLEELRGAFEDHAEVEDLRLAVLTGAGDKSFAAGGDLRELEALRTREQAAEMATEAKAALDAVRRFPLPVVAALNGDALGGGAELALACDFRVAAAGARLGFLQGRLNITTAWGGALDLFRTVGRTKGLALLCTAERVGGEEARAMGLFDRVAGQDESLHEVLEAFVAPIVGQAPQVLRAFKRLALEAFAAAPRAELDALETRLFSEAWVHQDHWDAARKILTSER